MKRNPLHRSATGHHKRCKVCRQPFTAFRLLQSACSPECAQELVRQANEKRAKAEAKDRREKLKTRGDWLRQAQQVFNAYIRLRDAANPCISCGRHHEGQWHAGHYRSTGAAPFLRFDEDNVHKQCQPCNTHLHGNLIAYRSALIAKIGADEVERLETASDGERQTVAYLKALIATYRAKTTALKKERA